MTELAGIVKEAISTLNAERKVDFEEISNETLKYQGNVDLGSEIIKLIIDCGNGYPDRYPKIQIVTPTRFYPHVDDKGYMCLFDDASLLIRTDMPSQMIIDAFDRALSILMVNPRSEGYKLESAREFNAYWTHEKAWVIYTNLSPCNGADYRELRCLVYDDVLIISDTKEESEYLFHNYFCKEDVETTETPCILIRLRSFAVPPIQKDYSWKQVRTFILKNITSSQKNRFQQFLNLKIKELSRFIILSIPAPEGDFYAGFWVHYKDRQYSKVEKNCNCKVEPIMTIPIDYSYLLNRAGQRHNGFYGKSVLLIGCGSVGGFLAANLCQSGITVLDLLDKDNLSVDNVHRHILGFSDAIKNKNKADLLKEYLEEQYPHVEIDSLGFQDRNAEQLLKQPDRLNNYDIIISATGEPTLNLKINRILYDNNISVPFIVCFNEPYGIGGHAIAVNLRGGCLQCLYTDNISNDIIPFRASFVEPNQDFKKSISGCAGSFVEYSGLDSQQTALITARLVLQILKGECKENRLISWVGTSNELIKNGYRASEYYEKISEKQLNTVSRGIPLNDRCVICKEKTITSE